MRLNNIPICCKSYICYLYVTLIYVTLNVLLFNTVLSLDIGLPKYLIGEFCTLLLYKTTLHKPHDIVC